MAKYLAITIGPIDKTLYQARKTRELWAASYVFSALMRELLNEMKPIGELLAPQIATRPQKGAGIYPDRCFFKLETSVKADTLNSKIQSAVQKLGNQLFPKQDRGFNPSEHFRVFAAELELKSQGDSSIILRLNQMLDALELQDIIPRNDLQLVSILENNILTMYRDAGLDGGKSAVYISFDNGRQHRLPSLLELATSELNPDPKDEDSNYSKILTKPTNEAVLKYQREKQGGEKKAGKHEADAQEKSFQKLKKELGAAVKFRHKYVCFIKADGDSIGKTIAAIGNHDQTIRDFSELLGKFAAEAVEKILGYGAIPVYAGGDDLLIIAPLQNAVGRHVFNLLEDIESIWHGEKFVELGKRHQNDFNLRPTLSFGISVAYYKYPMFEALDNMDSLLFSDAKSFTGKNALAFRVLKHSGQAFGATIGLGGTGFQNFKEILTASRGQEAAFLTSVMHKLTDLKPLLADALQHGGVNFFFKHHFNEQDHARSDSEKYLTAVKNFCTTAWQEGKLRKATEQAQKENRHPLPEEIEKSTPSIKIIANQIFATLRFVQFLNQEDHD